MIGYWISSGILALAFVVHALVGSREITRPLMNSDIPTGPKYTVFLCWHLVTIVLLVMALAFGWAAMDSAAWEVGLLATVLSGGFALWGLALQMWGEARFADLPQWTLFVGATACGVWSLGGM